MSCIDRVFLGFRYNYFDIRTPHIFLTKIERGGEGRIVEKIMVNEERRDQ